MNWLSNLFSKTTTTEENVETKSEEERKFDFDASVKQMENSINVLACIGQAYRAFYYLTSQETKIEVYKKLPKEVVEFIIEDMKGRDMSDWDNKVNSTEIKNERLRPFDCDD